MNPKIGIFNIVAFTALAFVITFSLALVSSAEPDEEAKKDIRIDAQADATLKAMSTFLATQGSFHLEAYETLDVVDGEGRKRQYSTRRSLYVQRPNKMRGASTGDLMNMNAWYDRSRLTILDREENVYMLAEVPPSIDEMLDYVANQYHVVIPLMDIALSNLYESFAPQVAEGEYLGLSLVDDLRCHHLAFSQEDIDWQLWVEDGEKPLPRKLIITYKTLPAQPQYTARIVLWELDLMFIPEFFEATLPDDAEQVPMMTLEASDSQGQDENKQQ